MPFDRPDPLAGITRAQVVTFFDGLELAEPGLGSTPLWRPGAGVPPRPLPGWAGVARKT